MSSFVGLERPPTEPKPSRISPNSKKTTRSHGKSTKGNDETNKPGTKKTTTVKVKRFRRRPIKTSSKPSENIHPNSTTTTTTATNETNIPLIFTLTEPVDVAHPEISSENPALVQSLESQASDWIQTIDQVSARVRSAPAVQTSCSVKDLPLAELKFWSTRTLQLEPLSKQAETEFMKNVTKVLMLAGSESGTMLRQSFASLRRLYIEAHWNAKYLKILEKPFVTLANGPMNKILVSIPGMVRTLKMTCISSRFYTSVEKMDSLLERVTLALCVRVADAADPARLIINLNSKTNDPSTVCLKRCFEILDRWEVAVTEAERGVGGSSSSSGNSGINGDSGNRRRKDSSTLESNGKGDGNKNGNKNGNSNGNNNEEDQRKNVGETKTANATKTTKTKTISEKENAWTLLNWNRLLQRPRHMKERVNELNELFVRFQCIQQAIHQLKSIENQSQKEDVDGNDVDGDDGEEVEKEKNSEKEHDQDENNVKVFEGCYRTIIASLLKAAAKRAHPRIGVLSTAAEGVYEPRCANKWNQSLMVIKNECMNLECQLNLTKNVSYEV